MNLISLKTELRQELKLTPQLLQSMEVLQMNSQELLDYLGNLSEENPTLELSEASELRSAYAELRQKASWLDAGTFGTSFAHEEDGPPEPGATDKELDSLSAFLCDQLERKRLPKPMLALCKYMAELVDEDGYLTQEDLDGLTEMKIPQTMVDQALDTIQSLEPAGVGARDLSECLVLQLSRRKDNVPYAMDIAARFLTELSRSHYGPITKALGASISEIQAAEKAIAALDPHPGQAFQPAEPTLYVRPDVFIVELEGELQVLLNEYYLPKVTVNPYYSSMAKESDDPEARTYLKEKLRQTKWLLDSLERRGSTLRRCAQAILDAKDSVRLCPVCQNLTDMSAATARIVRATAMRVLPRLDLPKKTRSSRDCLCQRPTECEPFLHCCNLAGSRSLMTTTIVARPTRELQGERPQCSTHIVCCARVARESATDAARCFPVTSSSG